MKVRALLAGPLFSLYFVVAGICGESGDLPVAEVVEQLDAAAQNKEYVWKVVRNYSADPSGAETIMTIARRNIARLSPDEKEQAEEILKSAEKRASEYRQGYSDTIEITLRYAGPQNFVARQKWLGSNSVYSYFVKDGKGFCVNDVQKSIDIIGDAQVQLRGVAFGIPAVWLTQFGSGLILKKVERPKDVYVASLVVPKRDIEISLAMNGDLQIASFEAKRAGNKVAFLQAHFDGATVQLPTSVDASYFFGDGRLDFRDEWSLVSVRELNPEEALPVFKMPRIIRLFPMPMGE